jgi:peptidoglycan DL-endopeptidase CwlO
VALTISLGTNPAFAATIAGKRAQAVRVKTQIDAINAQLDVANEDYNQARSRLGVLTVQEARTRAKLGRIRKHMGTLQFSLSTRADSMYRNGRMSVIYVLLGSKSFDEFSQMWDILRRLNQSDADAVAELKVARSQAHKAQVALSAQRKAARTQVRIMASRVASRDAKLAQEKRLLKGIQAEVAALQAAEEARLRAEAAARASMSYASNPFVDRNFPPPTHAARTEVVAIAKRYLGAPYVWAASGPNSFDCSGLTMFVYRQVGVSLPHSSRDQINCGQRVSQSQLQPGDLVFFGSPIHHVGIYIGGGDFIHAPHSGDVVKISSLAGHGGYAGACRP